MSADLTAFKKKELDRKTNHHDLTKAKTEEIFVLTKAIGEKETVALKLEQECEEAAQRHQDEAQERAGAQPRPARPPPWRGQVFSRTTEESQCCVFQHCAKARGYRSRRCDECPPLLKTSHQFVGAQREGPFARQAQG